MWHGGDELLPVDYGYTNAYGGCGCGCKGAPGGCGGEYGVAFLAALAPALPAIGQAFAAIAPTALGIAGAAAGTAAARKDAAAASCPQVAAIDAQIQAIKDSRNFMEKLIHTPLGTKAQQIAALKQQRVAAFSACQQQAAAAPYTNPPIPVEAPTDDAGINVNYLLFGGLAAVVLVVALQNKKKGE